MYVGDGGVGGGAGGNAKVYKTTNGGTTWATILSTGGNAGFINGIVFSKLNPQVGICQSDPPNGAGQPYWIAKTTNNGGSWVVENPTSSGSASSQNSVVCIDANFYGFGLNTVAKVGITTNAGGTWSYPTLVGAGGTFISGFTFKDDKTNGFACGNAITTTVSRTINGGTTWTSQAYGSPALGGYGNLKWVHGTNTVYLMGGTGPSGVCKRSMDGGNTWTTLTTSGLTGVTHFEYFKAAWNAIYLYAVCGDGSVLRYVDSTMVAIDPNNNTVPTSYSLEQNYPNPFNPSTTIKYSVPTAGNVSVKIYNSIGSEIMTVVNKNHTPGNYVETVDMGGLSSGIYFYILKSGDFSETKKMMLIK
jgi:photosystem II stability/assembly factor-like uncharacterized protein